jgi:hypothetical protein
MNLPDVLDGVRLIQNSTDWTKETEAGMEKWFFQYLNWLITSKAGKQEAQTVNNHGTWYTIQTSSIALFLNMTDVAKQIADTRFRKLVSVQIQRDGRQPFELLRTRSFDYSVLNLLGLFKLASIGQQMGLNLWTSKYRATDGFEFMDLYKFTRGWFKDRSELFNFKPSELAP